MKYLGCIILINAVALIGCGANRTETNSSPKPHLVVVSYGGGTYQQSHISAFIEPFRKSRGVDMESVVWGAEYGKLQDMVRSGKVPWDVVEVTAAQFTRGKRDSLYQPLTKFVPQDTFMPIEGSPGPEQFGVPNVYWSTVLAFNKTAFVGKKPTTWRDFWDTQAFPGPRALYDNPRGTLEFALLAAGVPKEKLYPLDVDRAFAMLDRIRPHVRLWWTDGTQPVNALLTGTVAMSAAWSGRIFASEQARKEISYTWNGAGHELDYWVIPKGSERTDLATEFILFASTPDPMARQAEATGYGPANKFAVMRVSDQIRSDLPTAPQNWAVSFVIDSNWWAQHETEVTQRWVRWKNK
jgi:putative spermidine/putrescine transport system substrate-binding protein